MGNKGSAQDANSWIFPPSARVSADVSGTCPTGRRRRRRRRPRRARRPTCRATRRPNLNCMYWNPNSRPRIHRLDLFVVGCYVYIYI